MVPAMDNPFALPVAQHVARREVGLSLGRGASALDAYGTLQKRLFDGLFRRFASGRRLDGALLSGMVHDVRATLEAMAPLDLREHARPATRGRPKGEAHEFLALLSYATEDDKGPVKAFVALRIWLSRKRAVIDQEFVGVSLTRHCLERAVERELATWTGGLRDVEDAVVRLHGLVVAWRWAVADGKVGIGTDVNLPLGRGLILGRMRAYGAGDSASRTVVDARGIVPCPLAPNEYHVVVRGGGHGTFLEYSGGTSVHEDALYLQQADYRDAVAALAERHAAFLAELGTYATWGAPDMQPRLGFEAVRGDIDAVAQGIAAIVRHPWLGQAIDPALREGTAG